MKLQLIASVLVVSGILSGCSDEPSECKALLKSTTDKLNAQKDATTDPSAKLWYSTQVDEIKAKFQSVYDDSSMSKQTKADMCKKVADDNLAAEQRNIREKQAAEAYKKSHGNVQTFVSTNAGNGSVNIRPKANQIISYDLQPYADLDGKLAACKVTEPCKIVMRVEGTKALDIVSATPTGASSFSEVEAPAPTTSSNNEPSGKTFHIVGTIKQGTDTSDVVATDGSDLTFITDSALGTTIFNACQPDTKCEVSGVQDGDNIQSVTSAKTFP